MGNNDIYELRKLGFRSIEELDTLCSDIESNEEFIDMIMSEGAHVSGNPFDKVVHLIDDISDADILVSEFAEKFGHSRAFELTSQLKNIGDINQSIRTSGAT